MVREICSKKKVKNAFFVFSATSHDFPFIYFYNTYINIWERIWEKGPNGNVFTNLIAENLPFQMLQTILIYS